MRCRILACVVVATFAGSANAEQNGAHHMGILSGAVGICDLYGVVPTAGARELVQHFVNRLPDNDDAPEVVAYHAGQDAFYATRDEVGAKEACRRVAHNFDGVADVKLFSVED